MCSDVRPTLLAGALADCTAEKLIVRRVKGSSVKAEI